MSITIRKIAGHLNIAVSTVSKALSNSHEISEETKQRILEYAARVNYIPNPYAGSLKNRKTRNIAVVLPEVADSFFSNAINGIESIAEQKGYHVMVYLTHENGERENSILHDLRSGRVDGVLLSVSTSISNDSLAHAELSKRIPLIFFDRVCEDIEASKVLTDDFEASYNGTKLLIEKGCKNPIFLSLFDEASIIDKRKQGFQQALRNHGLSETEQSIIKCSHSEADNLATLKDMLGGPLQIDGVVASLEKLALQCYTACKHLNISIPGQLRVIAFSNLQTADLLSPPLTTIVQPAYDMGKAAASLLFQTLSTKRKSNVQNIVLPSVIHERESTN